MTIFLLLLELVSVPSATSDTTFMFVDAELLMFVLTSPGGFDQFVLDLTQTNSIFIDPNIPGAGRVIPDSVGVAQSRERYLRVIEESGTGVVPYCFDRVQSNIWEDVRIIICIFLLGLLIGIAITLETMRKRNEQ